MEDIKFSSIKELQTLLSKEKSKKILVICGKNSFKSSGAEKFIKDLLVGTNYEFFLKKSAYPDLIELEEIIKFLKEEQ